MSSGFRILLLWDLPYPLLLPQCSQWGVVICARRYINFRHFGTPTIIKLSLSFCKFTILNCTKITFENVNFAQDSEANFFWGGNKVDKMIQFWATTQLISNIFVYIDVCLEFMSNNIGLKTNGVLCDLVLGRTTLGRT